VGAGTAPSVRGPARVRSRGGRRPARSFRSGVATLLPVDPVDARSRDVSFDGRPDGREERVLAELLQEAVAAKPVFHRVLHLGEAQLDPHPLEVDQELVEDVGRGHVDVRDRFGGHDDPAHRRRRLVDGRFDALSEGLGVREEQRGVPAEEDESLETLGLRISTDVVIALHALDSPEDRRMWSPRAPEERRQRDPDRREDTGHDPDEDDAGEAHE